MRDRERAGVVRGCREVGRRLEAAEEVRLLEEDRGGVRRGCRELVRVGHAVPVRHLDDLEAESRRVRLHDLAHLRVQRLGEDDLAPVGDVSRDEARVGRDRAAVVAGRVRDVHARQLADRPSGTRRSPAAFPGSSRAGRACTRSGTRRARARRRRRTGRSGRRCRRRRTRARAPVWTFFAASSSR